jgi:hypothetical protein
MKGGPILAELYAMKDVETKHAADQQEEANTSDPVQLVAHGHQVAQLAHRDIGHQSLSDKAILFG